MMHRKCTNIEFFLIQKKIKEFLVDFIEIT